MSTPLLEVRDLRVEFPARSGGAAGTVRAVDGLSFTLQRGQALGLVGESGCGKSTVARALVGLERPAAGAILLDGEPLAAEATVRPQRARRRMQMVFQDPYSSLDPRQTVHQILTEPLVVHGIGRRRDRLARAVALLDAVGLDAGHLDRYPHEFSGGQRQRIAVARALALEPELLVLDEPTSALDVSVRAQVVQLLRELRERFELTLLFITHDLALVPLLCERVAVMYLGRLCELGPCADVLRRPSHPYTQGLIAAVPVPDPALARARARAAPGGEVPSPAAPPPGCRYHPRCAERRRVDAERCAREEPRLLPLEPDGATAVACHLYALPQVPR